MSAEFKQSPHLQEIPSLPDSRPEKTSPLQAFEKRYPALQKHIAEFPHSTIGDCIVFLIMVEHCPLTSLAACSGLTTGEIDSLFQESFGENVGPEGDIALEVRQDSMHPPLQPTLPEISTITNSLFDREKRRQARYPEKVPERIGKRRPYSRRTTDPNPHAS